MQVADFTRSRRGTETGDYTRSRKVSEFHDRRDSLRESPPHVDPRFKSNRLGSKSQPAYIARRIDNSEVFSDKESNSPNTLAKISEERHDKPFKMNFGKSTVIPENELDDDLNVSVHQNETNIFTDAFKQTKYHEPPKGPIYSNGKLVKHSIVGSIEIFKRFQRRLNTGRPSFPMKTQESDVSFTSAGESVAGGVPKLLRLNTGYSVSDGLPTLGASISQQTKRVIENPNKREIKKTVNISKKELLTEIAEARARQEKFYGDVQATVKKMRATNALQFTKQERCLKNFEKIQDHWISILNTANGKAGRDASESITTKMEEHRMKKEQIDILEITKPDEERFGGSIWLNSLRNDNATFGKINKGERGRSVTGVRDRPGASVEIIRHPRLTPTPSGSWRTSFFRTGLNTTTDRSIKVFMEERIKKNGERVERVERVRAAGESIDTLMLQGENVLNLESDAAFKQRDQENTFPVILKRNKTENGVDREEEVLKENYDKRYFYMDGFGSGKTLQRPSGKSFG